jgi:hypothetical protein
MARDRILNFYLNPRKQSMVAAGMGIYGRIGQAVLAAGWQLHLRDETDAVGGPGYHLIYNRAVTEPFCLCLRRCYMDPFFRIEATNDRWDWDVAAARFTPTPGADWFRKYWQQRLFKDHPITAGGYIFMPLQGKLLEHRHFQAMSPIAMIRASLAADPSRRVLATLHPSERYSAAELEALRGIGGRFELSDQPSLALLAGCDYVVTQNSAMALTGFFAKKPAVLFGLIDFHHIAASVPDMGVEAAFRAVGPAPFSAYLHWFFKQNAISAEAEESSAQISARLRNHGWPI